MIVYALLEVELHGLQLSPMQLEKLRRDVETAVRVLHETMRSDSDVEVTVLETAGGVDTGKMKGSN